MKAPPLRTPAAVIFAHVPPPFHGQSYMVKLLLDGLRATATDEPPLRVLHVDARFSTDAADIGSAGAGKIWRAIRYAAQAIGMRFQHRARVLYYVPAPAKRNALYRDWIVMALCRPFFPHLVLHWHAVGLGEWTARRATLPERMITQLLLGRADASVVLSDFASADAEMLRPRRIEVIANGLPDPCPDFDATVRPLRERQFATRTSFTILFLAACTAEKGIFASVEAVALLKRLLQAEGSEVEVKLNVAGEFTSVPEWEQFQSRIAQSDLNGARDNFSVSYVGFADAALKARLLEEADCLCFPSVYPHEGQPVSIIEALAYDLPVIATRWRGIPGMLRGCVAFLLQDQEPAALAASLREAMRAEPAGANRAQFLQHFQSSQFAAKVGAILRRFG